MEIDDHPCLAEWRAGLQREPVLGQVFLNSGKAILILDYYHLQG